MKKKLKALVGLMALCAAGTVGSAFAAWGRNATTGTGTTPSFDQAIYLYWGSGSSTASIPAVENLSGKTTAYRALTVAPKSTKTVSGTVSVNFALSAATDCVITGLEINVYEVSALPAPFNDTSAKATIDALVVAPATVPTPDATLNPSALNDSLSIAIDGTTGAAHETAKYYIISVYNDGTAAANQTLGGSVTITQAFSPTGE